MSASLFFQLFFCSRLTAVYRYFPDMCPTHFVALNLQGLGDCADGLCDCGLLAVPDDGRCLAWWLLNLAVLFGVKGVAEA